MSEKRYALFPNGTSFMIWSDRNCEQCAKRYDESKHSNGQSDCAIENAISRASASDGTLRHCGYTPEKEAEAIATRLKWDGVSYLENDCPEKANEVAR